MSAPARIAANLRVPGPDGTALATDVHLPPSEDPVPVVVTRTAYDRSAHLAEGLGWARHGYGYVVQDVRGRYDSDGTWEPYRHERADGAALVDWVGAQPWCDGRLVALGGSYSGYTAWSLAAERPQQVRAVISLGPAMGLSRVKYDRSGILRLAEHATWWLERAEARTSRTGIAAAMFAAHPALLDELPVAALPARMWARLDRWHDAITEGPGHTAPEAVTDQELARLPAAALHIGGWYDLLLGETLHHWDTAGADLIPRPTRALLVGPWEHDLLWSPSTVVGDREHGAASRVAPGPLLLDWISHVLHPRASSSEASVFVLGANQWWTGTQWPPATSPQTWFTHAGGCLTPQPPDAPGRDGYQYDPTDPYPSADPAGDRRTLAARTDAVRYTSQPLSRPLTIAGTATVTLYADTSATSTDFVVRLLECVPDGRIQALVQGAVHTGHGTHSPYRLDLDAIAATLAAGSRLRLEVTSSDFPFLARNLNTGADRYRSAATAVADQTVHSGPDTPTSVTLPVLEDPWTSI